MLSLSRSGHEDRFKYDLSLTNDLRRRTANICVAVVIVVVIITVVVIVVVVVAAAAVS